MVTSLALNSPAITDLAPLRALTGLKQLSFGGPSSPKGNLADISPLAGMRLTQLTLSGMGREIRDLAPLRGMPLEQLVCRDLRQFDDLSPLAGMPLKHLDCVSTAVVDLTPLARMPLDTLVLSSRVTDLSPLGGMPLTRLEFVGAPITDLTMLKGMPLKTLWIDGSNVTDLTPLYGCTALTSLRASQTKVTAAEIAALQAKLPNCKVEWDDPAKPKTSQPAALGTK